jgi:aldose 1-epimerase
MTLTIERSGTRAVVEACLGGLIRSCHGEIGGRQVAILHTPPDHPVIDGFRWFGCWPMVPFANRVFGGIIRTPDGPVTVPINDPVNGNAMHGFGAAAVWTVTNQTDHRVEMEHLRSEGDDPYRYRAQQTVSIEVDGSMLVALTVENQAGRALPYGLGLHPWFACEADSTFQAEAHQAAAFAPGYRAIGALPVAGETDWRMPRVLKGGERVANWLDWTGAAFLRHPSSGYGLALSASDTLRFGLLWTPGDGSFVCFEPQSHIIGAPGHPVASRLTPLIVLTDGASLEGWMRISPFAH